MKIALIVDNWKLSIFNKHLESAGYMRVGYTEGNSPDETILVLDLEDSDEEPERLALTARLANVECIENRGSILN